MGYRTKIGVGIGLVGILGYAVYLATSNEVEFAPTAGAPAETPSVTLSTNTTIEQPAPLQKPDTQPSRANFSTALAEAPYKPSPNRKLLDSLSGEDRKRLVRSLRLDSESSEKLLDILADEANQTQLWLAANRRSFLTNEEGLGLRTESNALAKDLLGDFKFRQYDEYRNHAVERGPIDRLNERLGEIQSGWVQQEIDDALYSAIKEEASSNPAPRLAGYDSYTEFAAASRKWREENMKRFEKRAARILSAEQLEVLQKVLR